MSNNTIILAGGCFWGVEKLFLEHPGVVNTVVGYTGGELIEPSYGDVCTGETGHAEAVLIEYDESVELSELLDFFFRIHDPTTVNRQGNDVGTHYRSTIFYETQDQKEEAQRAIERANLSDRWKGSVVTTLEQRKEFYPAEEAHQKYLIKHPMGYSCHFIRD